jgi:hypothetical protein
MRFDGPCEKVGTNPFMLPPCSTRWPIILIVGRCRPDYFGKTIVSKFATLYEDYRRTPRIFVFRVTSGFWIAIISMAVARRSNPTPIHKAPVIRQSNIVLQKRNRYGKCTRVTGNVETMYDCFGCSTRRRRALPVAMLHERMHTSSTLRNSSLDTDSSEPNSMPQ